MDIVSRSASATQNRRFRGRISATEIAVHSDGSLRSTLAIAAMVLQLRVVTETP